jgi:methionyl-tRNA formyltransferase
MAVRPLRALVEAGHDIALCVTRPDRRRGRGTAVTPSPVKEAALELGIAVSHSMDDVADAGVELAVVVAYGRIIPASLLELVPMVNVHFSLLPRWRGAAPVERALLAGDRETGVCLMKIDEGLDTGPVYARLVVPIGDDVDLATLREQLVDAGCALLVAGLAQGVAGLPVPVPQEGEPTIAAKLTPADLALHWEQGADPFGFGNWRGAQDAQSLAAKDRPGPTDPHDARQLVGPLLPVQRKVGGGELGDHGGRRTPSRRGAAGEPVTHGRGGLGPWHAPGGG